MGEFVAKLEALIIDEHPSVRRALAARLTNTDQIHVQATASNLSEALVLAEADQPDVVILGLRVLDRERDITEINQMAETISQWGAALLILTSYSVDDDRKAILTAGARRYLLKDIDTERLLNEINRSVTESYSYAKRPQRSNRLPDANLPNTY